MARFPVFLLIGFAAPAALLILNLLLGYGGILGTVLLFAWLGIAIVLSPTEEERA